MFHIQTYQFYLLLIGLPMLYCFVPIYNNNLINNREGIQPLFNSFVMVVSSGNSSKTLDNISSQNCFFLEETNSSIIVELSDGINFVKFNKTINFKHINIALTTQIAPIKRIPQEIREHFYYSPSHNVLSPGVIISGEDLISDYRIDESYDDDFFEKENTQIQSLDLKQRLGLSNGLGKEVCVHNLTFFHFIAISATELGNKFYNLSSIPSIIFDSDRIFQIYMSVCFALICANMFTRWVVPSKEHLVLYIGFTLIFISFYHINGQFTHPSSDLKQFASINYFTPILFFSQILLKYKSVTEFCSAVEETLKYLWESYFILFIPLIIILLGTRFTSVCWFGVLILSSLIVKFTPKKVSIITKFSALICMAYILLFVNWDLFNFICVVPFFLLLI
ncbi:hypothetical protein EHI8A_094490 [Entamoeba histolytica HM-1:IMSS-B]|uniref:Uncharacterized protein n=6 Tax=Entamoeba histolytica TaxID=5759 RepID=C4M598_ENTH1|nr:hypothetical protein EHI_154220 [Entamoeba histolytica HM-1:IMSS]EMD43455.1 Hypothetical protein EHI5A_128340 [Entamoeba histolytica KU27]EMH76557.1 hypothetical protein EHI8A_094490 [Entamoeba histolytica HM-1:IMSS-B]EMS12615.1 hypothetical protein KM1_160620 [Entamoeba histolytica HM-3:IMSS]ENY60817.1 hypothetical protein EHI7A_089920 [Entamoeba histolytica HM-1:IMSS-A]GAT96577.1 hypothetical protein CL6EHI_154220 [Entamoeba histolytica]|eukprot:XP_650438.1 hypothetical protein EHI_154220 [Entamoeba histolytica HM-1:IMSS]